MSEQQSPAQSSPGQAQGQQQARRRRRGRRRPHGPRNADLWRQSQPLDEPQPIIPANDPAAVLRSLGTPPLQGHGALVDFYLAEVVKEASKVATALAATASLLRMPEQEEDQ